jgi:hypothetical protein
MKKRLLFCISLLTAVSVYAAAQENLITNYQFDEGTGTGMTAGNWGGQASLTIDETGLLSGDNCASFEIQEAVENSWDIQFFQAQVPVDELETYYFSFMISVEEEFEISFAWELEGEPYTKYWEDAITLHPDSTHYKRTIVPTGTDEIANFKMFLGYANNVNKTMFLDSIVLSTDPLLYGEGGSGTAVKLEQPSKMNVYPNPAEEYFNVEIGDESIQLIGLDLYSITGSKVATLLENNLVQNHSKKQFSTKDLLPGTYFLQLNTSKGTFNKKLIIK